MESKSVGNMSHQEKPPTGFRYVTQGIKRVRDEREERASQ